MACIRVNTNLAFDCFKAYRWNRNLEINNNISVHILLVNMHAKFPCIDMQQPRKSIPMFMNNNAALIKKYNNTNIIYFQLMCINMYTLSEIPYTNAHSKYSYGTIISNLRMNINTNSLI